jgi:hypothetical protein
VRNCRHTKDQVRFKKTLQLRRTLWNSPIRGNHSFHDFGFDAPDLRCEFQPLFQTNDSDPSWGKIRATHLLDILGSLGMI